MGSISPYYRRRRPAPQQEHDYLRDVSLRWITGRLGLSAHSLRALLPLFPPTPPGSVRGLLANFLIRSGVSPHVDLEHAHLPPYGVADAVTAAARALDRRVAAAVYAATAPHIGVRLAPEIRWSTAAPFKPSLPYPVDDADGKTVNTPGENLNSQRALLEMKYYGSLAPAVWHPTTKSLAAMAYGDFFPGARGTQLRAMVSAALMSARPGWCGTYGPGMGTIRLAFGKLIEGNYDMAQQHMLRTAYAYFNELGEAAREHLIRQLLARGRVRRINLDDTLTCGGTPKDWSRGGLVSPLGLHTRIGETENHNLMILAARYLSNQLLYQRNPRPIYDNRRNGIHGGPTTMNVVLYVLRNILLDDFSEYNAKSYQHETRMALLNLFNFAYDHEVRLAARMVLDYVSARMATSGNDCRRMVPFRRRNDGRNSAHTAAGKMVIGLLEWQRGADPMTEHMAMHTGATRAYDVPAEPQRPWAWTIASDGGNALHELLSHYRMPDLIADLDRKSVV